MCTQPHAIFCDESGFTGPNLLDPNQPYFIYGSVAISESEAGEIVSAVKRKTQSQMHEVKAKQLLPHSRGQDAITYILDELKGRYSIAYSHKKYALACKLFEYIFEPVLARDSALFYEKGFHRFIATLLFVAGECDASEQRWIKGFDDLVRGTDKGNFIKFLETIQSTRTGSTLSDT